MTEYPDILYTKEGHIATITLNRPDKMNSFSAKMSDSIYRAISDAAVDKKIRVIILTAKGRAFCAGADVKLDEPLKSGQVGAEILLERCDRALHDASEGDHILAPVKKM